MPGIDFAYVRKRVSILDVLALLEFRPVRCVGYRLRGPCPFACSRSGPDFVAYLDSNRYHCFRCRRSGNAIELWAAVRRLTLYAAAEDICRRLGIQPPLIYRW
jgi:DNA primase